MWNLDLEKKLKELYEHKRGLFQGEPAGSRREEREGRERTGWKYTRCTYEKVLVKPI
jgi:hypothetical protein